MICIKENKGYFKFINKKVLKQDFLRHKVKEIALIPIFELLLGISVHMYLQDKIKLHDYTISGSFDFKHTHSSQYYKYTTILEYYHNYFTGYVISYYPIYNKKFKKYLTVKYDYYD